MDVSVAFSGDDERRKTMKRILVFIGIVSAMVLFFTGQTWAEERAVRSDLPKRLMRIDCRRLWVFHDSGVTPYLRPPIVSPDDEVFFGVNSEQWWNWPERYPPSEGWREINSGTLGLWHYKEICNGKVR
jgi:hypothetical protein